MTRQEQKNKSRKQSEDYCRQGLMTVNMLFGAVNVLREQLKLTPFNTPSNLNRAIREAGIKPALKESGGRLWFKPEPILAALSQRYKKTPVRIFISADYATVEELKSGEWQPMNICHIKTGLPNNIISGWASKQLIPWRVNPETNERLFHLPTIYERSCWRECTSLKRRYGWDFYKQLTATRKTKILGCRLWVYAPELTILSDVDDEQISD